MISLQAIKHHFAACRDDAQSAAFYKKWTLVKGITNARLARLVVAAYAEKHPGCSAPGRLHRCTKLDLARHLAWVLDS
jgi:hypothetical protein